MYDTINDLREVFKAGMALGSMSDAIYMYTNLLHNTPDDILCEKFIDLLHIHKVNKQQYP